MAQTMKIIKTLSPVILVLGISYLTSGFISIYNWCVSVANVGCPLYPSLMPGDLGLAIVTLTIGASLTISIYYILKENRIMHLASATCGMWLALGVLMIQIMVAIAAILDSIITGGEVNYSIISSVIKENILRIDVILGCIILPISIPYTLMLKKLIEKRSE